MRSSEWRIRGKVHDFPPEGVGRTAEKNVDLASNDVLPTRDTVDLDELNAFIDVLVGRRGKNRGSDCAAGLALRR